MRSGVWPIGANLILVYLGYISDSRTVGGRGGLLGKYPRAIFTPVANLAAYVLTTLIYCLRIAMYILVIWVGAHSGKSLN